MKLAAFLCLSSLATGAIAIKCPGAECGDFDYLGSGDCATYHESIVRSTSTRLKVRKRRTVLFSDTADNCHGHANFVKTWSKEVEATQELSVTGNSSYAVDLATSMAIGIKNALGVNSGITTTYTQGGGVSITAKKVDSLKWTVTQTVPPRSFGRFIVTVVSITGAGVTKSRTIAATWYHDSTYHLDNCTVTAQGGGKSYEHFETKPSDKLCACEAVPEPNPVGE